MTQPTGRLKMTDMRAILDEIYAQMREALERAYQAGIGAGHDIGFSDGQKAMRDAIIAAASAPLSGSGDSSADVAAKATAAAIRAAGLASSKSVRAPRGAVRPIVQRVLEENPGLGAAAISARIRQIDSQISPHSVSNELHRNRGLRYWQNGSGQWFLSPEAAEAANDHRDLEDMMKH
jgi:hypothetical protein